MASSNRLPTSGFSIQKKLLVGFGVLLALLGGIVALSISTMSGLDRHARTLGNRDLEAIQALGATRTGVMTMRAAGGDNLNAPSPQVKTVTAQAIRRAKGDVLGALAVYEQHLRDAADRGGFEAVRQGALALATGADQVLALNDRGDVEAAKAKFAALQPVIEKFNNDSRSVQIKRHAAAQADVASAAAQYQRTKSLLILVGLVCLAVGVGIALVLSRRITAGVRQLQQASRAIAQGDVQQEVTAVSRDEVGATAAAFREMIAYLEEMTTVVGRVADGDLTVRVKPRSERDLLGNGLKRLVAQLRQTIGRVAAQAGNVNASSQQMAQVSEETGRAVGEIAAAVSAVAEGSERQVRLVEATRETVHHAADAASASAAAARTTATAADDTRTVAHDGVAAAGRASEAIQLVAEASSKVGDAITGLSAKSERIGGIVDTITGIAGQTNLLALNAAIEAARAGEHGRGFAVVAEEVRQLAEQSRAATAEIAALIAEIQAETHRVVEVVEHGAQRTEDGVATVMQTRDAFERIDTAVEDMHRRVEDIATTVQHITSEAERAQSNIGDVASVAEHSAASAEEVSASTQQTSASTQEVAASASSLAATADQLRRLVEEFQLP